MTIDLDDTSRCPVAEQCASCGAGGDLAVATASTLVGVICLTLCVTCADRRRIPAVGGWAAVMELVCQHCEHLGITVDDASVLLGREQEE